MRGFQVAGGYTNQYLLLAANEGGQRGGDVSTYAYFGGLTCEVVSHASLLQYPSRSGCTMYGVIQKLRLYFLSIAQLLGTGVLGVRSLFSSS